MQRGGACSPGVGTALLLLCVAGPAAAGEDALTAAQREAVEQVVREYLRDNPEVLVDAIRALRAKREAAEQARKSQALVTYSEELRNDPASPVGGNPNGDVTVVEFFDYGCPYCKKVLPSIMTLLESDGNIRYVFKEFPILGPASHVAARAALAAWNLDKDSYLPFHAAMMGARGRLTEARIMKIAEDNGIDGTALRRAMADPKIDAALKGQHRAGQCPRHQRHPGLRHRRRDRSRRRRPRLPETPDRGGAQGLGRRPRRRWAEVRCRVSAPAAARSESRRRPRPAVAGTCARRSWPACTRRPLAWASRRLPD